VDPPGRGPIRFPAILPLLASIATAFGAGVALAIPPPQPGLRPEFGVSAYFMERPRYLTVSSILVIAWGGPQYDSLAVGQVRMELPPGIAWVWGDTLRDVAVSSYSRRPMSDRRWEVVILPERTGRYEVRLNLRIDGGPDRGVDETEFVMPLEVRTDSVRSLQPPPPTRFERVRGQERFRFADGYLVPIDTTEALLESEIEVKPYVLGSTLEAAPQGLAAPAGGVPFVAMVGKDGQLLGAQFLEEVGGPNYDPRLIDAARRSIDHWRFAPALAHGHTVADYVIVRVHFGPPG